MNKLQLIAIASIVLINLPNSTFRLAAEDKGTYPEYVERIGKQLKIRSSPTRSDPFLSFFSRVEFLSELILNFETEHESDGNADSKMISLRLYAMSLSQQYEELVTDIIPKVSIDNQIIEEIVKPLKLSASDEEIKSSICLATQDLTNASISDLKHMAEVFQTLVPLKEYIDQYKSMLRRVEAKSGTEAKE
jgi:hypothetical protein